MGGVGRKEGRCMFRANANLDPPLSDGFQFPSSLAGGLGKEVCVCGGGGQLTVGSYLA